MTTRIENALGAIRPWEKVAPAIDRDEREQRIERARALMASEGADALVISAGASLRYFTGIGWGMIERLVAMVLTMDGTPIIICPAFEAGSLAAVLAIDAEVRTWEEHESPYRLVAQCLGDEGCEHVALDPTLPFQMAESLRAASPGVAYRNGSRIVDGCRSIKSEAELALMRQAKQMTLEVQRRARDILVPGIAASTVTRFIDEAHRSIGSSGSSFCIVLFGASTSFPHGLPSDDILREGDVVLIDTGCVVQGYHSDITRTYVFGEPDDLQRRMWHIEQEAQQAAFDAAAPGVPCEHADAAARRVIERAGLGPDYQLPGVPHRTGHGSVFPSTRARIWYAATLPRCERACAFPTSP